MRAMEYQRRLLPAFGGASGAIVYDSGAKPQQTQQMSNQNTNSTTGPNPTIAPILQGGINDLSGYYQQNPNAPGYYPGSTVAQPSGATNSAINALFTRGLDGSPLIQQGQTTAGNILNPNYLNVGNDPYFKASIAAGLAPQTENFNNSILPNLRSQFEGSGRNLGGADMGTAQTAAKNLDTTQSNAVAQATQQQYQANQQNQLGVLQMLPSFQNMDYQNIGAMTGAGQATDQINQNNINADVARYNYGTTAQPNYISDFLSRIGAGYPGGQTTGQGSSSSMGSYTPASNSTSSFLGGGMGLAGLALQAAPLLGFSDARLKDIKGRVGETDEGLPLYLYSYKGDDQPRIGPMAQEVAQIHPEAVAEHPSGYLMVDYAKATPPGGLF